MSLRFFGVHVLVLATTLGLALGGAWMWLGLGTICGLVILGDELLGDDFSEPAYAHPVLLDLALYLTVPLLALACFLLAWLAGADDPTGFGAWVQATLGHDLGAAREASGPLAWVGAVTSMALTLAAVGTNVGHELTHRTASRGAVLTGRWLLALTFDAEFSIEHVYGHHRRLATDQDPATARRGEHFYAFLLRSIVGQTQSARRLERERLARRAGDPGLFRDLLADRYLRGWCMSAALALGFGLVGGIAAVGAFVITGLLGRTVLEAVNYFEHYGLVREPGAAVETRHSWNSNRALSNVVLFNLARHSHHHAEGDARFWQLRARREAPTLPYGYLTCMLLVYFAPGWFRNRMTPLLLDWDRRHANAAERRIAEQANRASGLAGLERVAEAAH